MRTLRVAVLILIAGAKATPLHSAAEKGDDDQLKALLAAGAKLGARDDRQQTALHVAASFGHTDAVPRST